MTSLPIPAHLDASFAPAVCDVAEAFGGSDPLGIAALLFSESDINPTIENSIGCVGINQFCPSTAKAMGIEDQQAYRQLSACQQLRNFVFPFWSELVKAHHVPFPVSARDLYWLNFLPATYVPNAPDSHVITRDPGIISENEGFDTQHKGFITAGDMQLALVNAAHGQRWDEIAALIQEEQARRSSTSGRALVGTILFLGAASAALSYAFFPAQTLHTARMVRDSGLSLWQGATQTVKGLVPR